jgi:hypothetical protein
MARDLVPVEPQDPVSPALRVQPPEVPLEVVPVEAQNTVGVLGVVPQGLLVTSGIGPHDDLVGYAADTP